MPGSLCAGAPEFCSAVLAKVRSCAIQASTKLCRVGCHRGWRFIRQEAAARPPLLLLLLMLGTRALLLACC